MARVRALLRKASREALSDDPLVSHRDVTLSASRREVIRNGAPIELTGREFDLLALLLSNALLHVSGALGLADLPVVHTARRGYCRSAE